MFHFGNHCSRESATGVEPVNSDRPVIVPIDSAGDSTLRQLTKFGRSAPKEREVGTSGDRICRFRNKKDTFRKQKHLFPYGMLVAF